MNTFTIYTLGGGDVLWSVFNALASLLNPQKSSAIMALVSLGSIIGATMMMWYLVFGVQLQQVLKWFMSYTLLTLFVMSPSATVIIKDGMTNHHKKIDHVPLIMALGSSLISSLGNGLTHIIEQAFQSSPTESVGGIGIQGNLAPSYTQTGMIFGADVLQNMKRVAFDNHDLQENMHSFVNQCVTYDALIGKKYTLHDLKHSADLWGLVSRKASKLRSFPWRMIERDGDYHFVRSHGTQIISCYEGVRRFNEHWQQATQSSLETLSKRMGMNQSWAKEQTLSDNVKTHLPGALDKLTNNSKSAVERIKQQLMITNMVHAVEQKRIELGGSLNFEVMRAYTQQRDTYQTIGHVIAQGLPSIKNVLEALLYCLFIFVMMLIFMPDGIKLLVFYFKILFWLQLWAPLFAILNFIMTEATSWRAIHALHGAEGITIGNFVGLTNMTSDMAAMAGYLCAMIPMLSWMILEKGGYVFANIASSLLGVAQGAATQSAYEKATGNYSFGNQSFGNQQMFTATQLKQDYAPTYSAYGHMTTNDGRASVTTTAEGEKILTMNESHLPVSVNVAKTQENALRENQRELYSFAEGEQVSAQKAQQQAHNNYLEIGKQVSKMQSLGTQFSDQQQAQVMHEAVEHYNRVESLSNKTGLSKDYINQKVFDISSGASMNGGFSVGVASLSADIGSKLTKSQSANMSANQIAEEMLDISKQANFNTSHQRMDNAFKAKSFDINDQELKQAADNFSSSYETMQRHEQSANKSFEKAKSLDKEIAYTQTHSASINASHAQPFVEHVGIEELKKMTLQEMERKAFNYAQNQKVLDDRHGGKRKLTHDYEQLRRDYLASQKSQVFGGEGKLNESHQQFKDGYFKDESPKGIRKAEEHYVRDGVDDKIKENNKKVMEAEFNAKNQHVKAKQMFDVNHNKHAEENMGFAQGGGVKSLKKEHEERKKNA